MANSRFSIKETVNRNIEKYQFPSFHSHRSLIGWCSMNYSKVLMNPQYMPPPRSVSTNSRKLESLYQIKSPACAQITIKRPFSNLAENKEAIPNEGIGHPPLGYKPTDYALTTTKRGDMNEILENTHSLSGYYSPFKPLSSQLGESPNENFTRKIKQIGEISYSPKYKTEEVRHLKKLPNSIITEQSLMDILNSELKYLNLQNHVWINNQLICKIGYLAPNIEELNLHGLEIDDTILVELGKTCKSLKKITISKCKKLTTEGVQKFLALKPQLVKFCAAENPFSITDESTKNLHSCERLESLNVGFCSELSDDFLKSISLSKCKLKELTLTSLKKLSSEHIITLIKRSQETLQTIDLTLLSQKEVGNSILAALGLCRDLRSVSLTGCIHMDDDGFNDFLKYDHLKNLETLKLGGLSSITETSVLTLVPKVPNLKLLELNGHDKLTDFALSTLVKSLSNLENLLINFTPNITANAIEDLKALKPRVNIVRNINSYSNPADDGLRMPLIPKKIVLKKKAKKKKKK